MTNLVRRDPYGMSDVFDDPLKGFFVRPIRLPGEEAELPLIRMDMKEDEGAYTVHAEMPGVKKEDIHVSIEGNRVSISAETKRESERKEGEKLLRSERYHGKIFRGFTLAQDVDEATATARFENGVLELSLPKKATSTAHKLLVE